jgi:hypothetical protein
VNAGRLDGLRHICSWSLKNSSKCGNSGIWEISFGFTTKAPILTWYLASICQRERAHSQILHSTMMLVSFVAIIEVTEWLEPYRRRDQEYNRPFEGGAKHVGGIGVNLPSPIKSLEVLLQKKVRKKSPSYPRNTWLLVDDNVGLADYEWANRPLGDVEVARRVVDNLKGELRNISQVWLLREVGTPMTVHRLYPVE